jgi:hypothetical protein
MVVLGADLRVVDLDGARGGLASVPCTVVLEMDITSPCRCGHPGERGVGATAGRDSGHCRPRSVRADDAIKPVHLSANTIIFKAFAVKFASCFQYTAPMVFGMISDAIRINMVITVETMPTISSSVKANPKIY